MISLVGWSGVEKLSFLSRGLKKGESIIGQKA